MIVGCLGSGSGGNAWYVSSGDTRVLVDAGFSGVETERRLGALGVEPGRIDAVVVTHEHRDHTAGAGVVARRWGWTLHMSPATRRACDDLLHGGETVRTFEAGEPFALGDLAFRPFLTCHDAADPLAVTVVDRAAGLKLGMATDLGRPTGPVRHALSGSHFLVLEANHDERMLRESPYPWSVKQRIGGSRGHLSNRVAAELAADLHHPGMGGVLLAHLSRECNEPDLARSTVGEALRDAGYSGSLHVADQETPGPLFDVGELVRRGRPGPQLDLFRRRGAAAG